MLARAGVERLGYDLSGGSFAFEGAVFHAEILPLDDFLPAGGQGVIALQVRSDDEKTKTIVERDQRPARRCLCLQAEREFLRLLQGDCDSPVGVLATIESGRMTMRAQVFEPARIEPQDRREWKDQSQIGAEAVWRAELWSESMADKKSKGKCFLVGAGPGDLGLVTLRAKECIEQAEVIVYDYLCNPEMLNWAPESAELIYAGKKAGAHTLTQDEINALLVEKARAGKQVVRLKGGDPFVFGRGGEEAQALAAADVPFVIVPGITSAIAGPAYAGNSGHASRKEFARHLFYRPRRSGEIRKLDRLRGARATRRHASDADGRGADRSDRARNAGERDAQAICRWR